MREIHKLRMAMVGAFVVDANDERVEAVAVDVAENDVAVVDDENVAADVVDDVLAVDAGVVVDNAVVVVVGDVVVGVAAAAVAAGPFVVEQQKQLRQTLT